MSVRKVAKAECGNTPADAAAWLAEETGGQCIVAGQIQDKGDHFVIPVFSADGRSEFEGNGAAAGRRNFTVLAPGVASDGTRFQGQMVEFFFPKSEGLEVGDVFSANIPLSIDIDPASIFVESGPNAEKERKDKESAGGPEREKRGWQPNLGTPDTGLGGGKPHNGRFSNGRE
ncbi:MAG: hypothetical protein WBF09_05040 [Candidatus Acidiferrum sp.]